MPLQTCSSDGKPGFRWGESGRCYTYASGDSTGRRAAKQKAIKQGIAIEGPDAVREQLAKAHSVGLYIACWLPVEVAADIAIAGGELPETLHVTLAYLGELEDLAAWVPGDAVAAAARAAARTAPLDAVLPGLGIFKGRDSDVLYASVDSPGLTELRERLVDALRSEAIEPVQEHGFTPRVTLAYLLAGTMVDAAAWAPVPVALNTVSVVSDDDGFRVDLPLLGPALQTPAAANPTRVAPSAEDVVRIAKLDEERRLVYGIVLEPGVEDSQGDIVTEADIELAAHRFLKTVRFGEPGSPEFVRIMGLQHMVSAPSSVTPVESYLAPADLELGGQPVRKGSWVLVSHIDDVVVWDAVKKGVYSGYSVAGTGVRRPLPALVEPARDGLAGMMAFGKMFDDVVKRDREPQPITVEVHPQPVTLEVNVPEGAIVVNPPDVVISEGAVRVDVPVTVQAAPAPVIENRIELPEFPAPTVNVEVKNGKVRRTLLRDGQGRPSGSIEEPIDEE